MSDETIRTGAEMWLGIDNMDDETLDGILANMDQGKSFGCEDAKKAYQTYRYGKLIQNDQFRQIIGELRHDLFAFLHYSATPLYFEISSEPRYLTVKVPGSVNDDVLLVVRRELNRWGTTINHTHVGSQTFAVQVETLITPSDLSGARYFALKQLSRIGTSNVIQVDSISGATKSLTVEECQ